MNWFINFFHLSGVGGGSLGIGNRVLTPHGMGTVVGGTVHVKLDKRVKIRTHENDRTQSFNLENVKNWS